MAACSSGLLISASRRALSVDPIHPSLSDLAQDQGQLSHLHRKQRLTTAQDEKAFELGVLSFETKKVAVAFVTVTDIIIVLIAIAP